MDSEQHQGQVLHAGSLQSRTYCRLIDCAYMLQRRLMLRQHEILLKTSEPLQQGSRRHQVWLAILFLLLLNLLWSLGLSLGPSLTLGAWVEHTVYILWKKMWSGLEQRPAQTYQNAHTVNINHTPKTLTRVTILPTPAVPNSRF